MEEDLFQKHERLKLEKRRARAIKWRKDNPEIVKIATKRRYKAWKKKQEILIDF